MFTMEKYSHNEKLFIFIACNPPGKFSDVWMTGNTYMKGPRGQLL